MASEITHFRGILPPEGQGIKLPPSQASPGGLIWRTLGPLRGELDMALTQGDRPRALRLAYAALGRVANALAEMSGGRVGPDQARIHALLVQLALLPLEARPDGTLSEGGTQIEVHYRNWVVERAEAEAWAERLLEHFESLWPGAWVVVDSR
jgi:hypothetical protein